MSENIAGKLFVVGTPIGNLGDISPRAIETLKSADFIAAEDTRVSGKLLSRFGIETRMVSFHKYNESEKSGELIRRLQSGENGAIITDAGMPCISDPGEILVRRCREQGVEVVVVPGCNAAVAAVAVSGLHTERFVFEGFLPTENKPLSARLEEIAPLAHTLVFYEAPHRLLKTLSALSGALGNRNCAACRELTKLHETVLCDTLDGLYEYYSQNPPRGEFVLVVEGNKHEEKAYTLEEAVKIAAKMVGEGKGASAAAKSTAAVTGIAKGNIYRELVKD